MIANSDHQIEYADEDYFVSTNGKSFSVCKGLIHVASSATWIEAVYIIRKHARAQKDFPNVWKATIGENFSLVENFKY